MNIRHTPEKIGAARVTAMGVDLFRLKLFLIAVDPDDRTLCRKLLENLRQFSIREGVHADIEMRARLPELLDAKIKTGKAGRESIWLPLQRSGSQGAGLFLRGNHGAGLAGSNSIRAWAQAFGTGYRFDSLYLHPRVFAQYDYASGDKNPNDGVHGTFDTMYPTAHDRFGIADLFGCQNIVATRTGFTIEPHRRWTVTAQYLDFWLASANDSPITLRAARLFAM